MPRTAKYVPILKTREGELNALHDLDPSAKSSILPVLEATKPDWDFEAERPKKTVAQHLSKLPQTVAQKWGTSDPILIDMSLLDPANRMEDGSHPVGWISDKLLELGVKSRPVFTPQSDPNFKSSVRSIVALAKQGAGLRIGPLDLLDPSRSSKLQTLLQEVGVDAAEVDLLVDLGPLTKESTDLYRTLLPWALAAAPLAREWGSFTVAASGFPINLSEFAPGLATIPRLDWALWKQLASQPNIPEGTGYGDYAIQHQDQVSMNPKHMKITASVRYTTADNFLVAKGRSIREHGSHQYFDICKLIVDHPEFCKTTHCHGDVYIHQKSMRLGTPGSPAKYRYAGTLHHLTFAAHQVATWRGASGSSG